MAVAAPNGISPPLSLRIGEDRRSLITRGGRTVISSTPATCFPSLPILVRAPSAALRLQRHQERLAVSCLTSSSPSDAAKPSTTKLYVSGLSFRTTEEGLRNAFEEFGELVEVNLVMDRRANRPRGFAFLRYATVEESQKAIEGMHGKFLDGRVIFVEVAKPRLELPQRFNQTPRHY